METPASQDADFPLPLSLTVARLGIRASAAPAEDAAFQPRECGCVPGLTGSGGDFGFDDGMRSLRRD